VICFGPFELDAANGELRKAGISLKIQPQPFRVLVLLAEQPGRAVSREDIQRLLWGDNTFVDFERGINSCVNQIRTTLGDDPEKPRYIETIPRRGYRFVASVTSALLAERAASLDVHAREQVLPKRSNELALVLRKPRLIAAITAAGVALAVTLGI
jgi:DNA-binding winged helix-turn-helix (wHTH) protein